MDLQKEQDSNTHGSGWMLVICKHWNWNWHWNWKYYFFLTKGGDIVWVTASTKLRDLLITWSGDKVTDLYLVFHNTYGHQTCQSSNLQWGGYLQSHVTCWLRGHETNVKPYIFTFAIPMATKLDRVVTCGGGNPTFKVTWPIDYMVTWQMKKSIYLHFNNIYGHQTWHRGNLRLKDPTQ